MQNKDTHLRFFPSQAATSSTPLVPVDKDSELLDVSDRLKPKCCTPQHCCNAQCVVKHAFTMGSVGQQSLLYVETAFTVLNAWGAPETTTGLVFTIIMLLLCFAIMSKAQHRAYIELIDKLLKRFIPNDSERASCTDILKKILSSCCAGSCSDRTHNVIGILASLIKVGLQTFACVRFLSRIFYDWIHMPDVAASVLVKFFTTVLSILNTGGQLSFFLNTKEQAELIALAEINNPHAASVQKLLEQVETTAPTFHSVNM